MSKSISNDLDNSLPCYPYYPTHFLRGTQINIDNNKSEESKLVENLKAEDFQRIGKLQNDKKLQMVIGRVKEINLESVEKGVNIVFLIEEFINPEEQIDPQVNNFISS